MDPNGQLEGCQVEIDRLANEFVGGETRTIQRGVEVVIPEMRILKEGGCGDTPRRKARQSEIQVLPLLLPFGTKWGLGRNPLFRCPAK